jgi:hypothetical protein
MLRTIVTTTAILLAAALHPTSVQAAETSTAIVIQDQAILRAAPRDSANQQVMLWQGEALEVRAERLDYLQVWDYKRERGGYIRADQVRRVGTTPHNANELLGIVRFLPDTSGAEAMGIGYSAAFLKAAPAEVLRSEAGAEALDALGGFADRLARRASLAAPQNKNSASALTAHLDVASRYGVRFFNIERDGRMQVCYDGEAFRHVLGMNASVEQRARAALALTQERCAENATGPTQRLAQEVAKAELLDKTDPAKLSGFLKNRVLMRRAGTWSSIAFQHARKGEAADLAANRALTALASVSKTELTDDDLPSYDDAAMRANANRWAGAPNISAAKPRKNQPSLISVAGEPGQTCLVLQAAGNEKLHNQTEESGLLTKRCTYGIAWQSSISANAEGTAVAIAVQQTESWRELWVFAKSESGWSVSILPPALAEPNLGYAEFAGWVPGGKQMLVAREARADGKYKHNFEVVSIDSMVAQRQASDPSVLGAFQRWQDPMWKQLSFSVR